MTDNEWIDLYVDMHMKDGSWAAGAADFLWHELQVAESRLAAVIALCDLPKASEANRFARRVRAAATGETK